VNDMVDSASDERTVNNDVRHQYRVLSESEKRAMTEIKDAGLAFLDLIDRKVYGREASLAKTKIEEAVMWAVKGLTA
jgi:ribonucleotide reductase beta subunit family protein with ferritin-like domain